MKSEDSHILNILYNPVTYIHPDYFSDIFWRNSATNDVLTNYWVFNKYRLDDLPGTWQPDDAISALIFEHWQILPKIAYFIGGYLLREHLLIERMTLIIDSQLLAFISLPLRHTINISVEKNKIHYATYGAAFIIDLAKNLPAAIRQRLLLLFPPDIIFPKVYAAKTPDHINLFRMAIKYAHDPRK